MSFVAPDYRAEIRRFVDGYTGECETAILRVGDVFDLYSRLMVDPRVTGEARNLVAVVLAYFVIPDDVLPEEELGPYGMIDDLFLAAHVYRLLSRMLEPSVLTDAWAESDELDEVMNMIFDQSRSALGKQRKDVLRLAGL
ncbi:YkvA family protein [Nannocystaceae bacterium ST9]